jgi:hypothetical protein
MPRGDFDLDAAVTTAQVAAKATNITATKRAVPRRPLGQNLVIVLEIAPPAKSFTFKRMFSKESCQSRRVLTEMLALRSLCLSVPALLDTSHYSRDMRPGD